MRRPHRTTVLVFVLVSLLSVLGGARVAAAPISFGPPAARRVTVEDMAVISPGSGAYYDKYTVEGTFKGGGTVYFSVLHRSFGVGKASFEVETRCRSGDGSAFATSETLAEGKWSQSTDGTLVLAMGRHRLEGTPKQWTIRVDGEMDGFALTFRPTEKPWRPGSGRAHFGDEGDKYLDMTVLAPRARFSGTVRMGGEEREVKGRGYAIHTSANMAIHEITKRWMLFHTERAPLSIFLREVEPAGKWGGPPFRSLLVAREGKVLFESTSFEVTPDEVTHDDGHANRYALPGVLRVQASDGGADLKAVIKVGRRTGRKDHLEGMTRVERVVASKFAQPVSYAYRAAYRLELTKGGETEVFEGRGFYELDHVSK